MTDKSDAMAEIAAAQRALETALDAVNHAKLTLDLAIQKARAAAVLKESTADKAEPPAAKPAAPANDDKPFFDHIRGPLFNDNFTQGQVDGLNAILALGRSAPPSSFIADQRWLAYALGTAYLETGHTMQPIGEYGGDDYFFRMYDMAGDRPGVAHELGNDQPGDGVRYHGRGYVQLTGRANYRRLGQRLGVDLEGNPDLALDPSIAARIMAVGMTEGMFTGKKLADYFPDGGTPDWLDARRIINRLDRAQDVAGYAQTFLEALQA